MKHLHCFIFILFAYHRVFSQDNTIIYQKILTYLQHDSIVLKFSHKEKSQNSINFDVLLTPFADSNPFASFSAQVWAKENNIHLDSARNAILDTKNIQLFRKKFENYFGKWFNYQILMYLKKSRNAKSRFLLEFSNPCEGYILCNIYFKDKNVFSNKTFIGTYLFYCSVNTFILVDFIPAV